MYIFLRRRCYDSFPDFSFLGHWCQCKNGGTFLYRRVNGVFNATIRWYSCSDVLCICYFNTYTENSPILLYLHWNFSIFAMMYNGSIKFLNLKSKFLLFSDLHWNFPISCINETFYVLKTKVVLALYTALFWVSFGMSFQLCTWLWDEFGTN